MDVPNDLTGQLQPGVMVAKDMDGRIVRLATTDEAGEYVRRNDELNAHRGELVRRLRCFDRPQLVGEVVVDLWTGPGVAHAGAGF